LLSARERAIWIAGAVAVSALLILLRFTSLDSDSVRYATLSAKLAELPMVRWVAPEWWGLTGDTDLSGYFLEHPAGLFFIPTALARLGLPPNQAPYVFGLAMGLAALLLTGRLLARVVPRDSARAALTLLQIMPLAFVFRIRDNHEYPMLVCLLLVLIGLDRTARFWSGAWLVAAGVVGGLLVKGVFVSLVLLGAGAWMLVNPTRGSRVRQMAACAAAIAAAAVAAVAYDAWYKVATGGPFWIAYWHRQIAPMSVAAPLTQAREFAEHLGFYLLRLLSQAAPWSLAAAWALFRRDAAPSPERARRAWRFVLVFASATIVLLSLASRFAERYEFSATFLVGAAGCVLAFERWSGVRRAIEWLDARVPALPAVTWIVLVTLRLVLGPWLPRLGGG